MKNELLTAVFGIIFLVSIVAVSSQSTSPTIIVCNTTSDCPQVSCGLNRTIQCTDRGLTFRYCACLEPDSPLACAQVITYAKNPNTNECKDFPTPCDVPSGWYFVDTCESPIILPPQCDTIPSNSWFKTCTLLPPCTLECSINFVNIAIIIIIISIVVLFIYLLASHKW